MRERNIDGDLEKERTEEPIEKGGNGRTGEVRGCTKKGSES